MIGYVVTEKGWIKEIFGGTGPVGSILVANQDLLQLLKNSQFTIYWDGSKFYQVKDPKAIWKRVRANGFSGMAAKHALQQCLDHLDSNLPDIPKNVNLGTPAIVQKRFAPDFETEIKPGLKVTVSGEEDIDIWEEQMIASGLYTKEEAWSVAARWFSDPMVWMTKVTYKGQPLKLEHWFLNQYDKSVRGDFLVVIDQKKPLWFWKPMYLPIFKSLYAYGFEYDICITKATNTNFISYLKTIGFEALKQMGDEVYLRFYFKDWIKQNESWLEQNKAQFEGVL